MYGRGVVVLVNIYNIIIILYGLQIILKHKYEFRVWAKKYEFKLNQTTEPVWHDVLGKHENAHI